MGDSSSRNGRSRQVRPDGRLVARKNPSNLVRVSRPQSDEGPSEPLKAAVLAALLVGQPSHQIAQQFGLPHRTVKKWEEAYSISNPTSRRDRISETLVVFVEQEIASLLSISIATSDEEWIKEQPASEIASLIAVKHDRLYRILEAFGRANSARQPQSEEIDA